MTRWQRFRIRTVTGPRTIRAVIRGAWAAHPVYGTFPSDNRWAVTHVPSGFRVPPPYYAVVSDTDEHPLAETEAREVCALLAARADVSLRVLQRYGRDAVVAIIAEALDAAAELSGADGDIPELESRVRREDEP